MISVKRQIVKTVTVAAGFTAIVLLFCYSPLNDYLHLTQWQKLKADLPWYPLLPAMFVLIGSLAIGAGLPRTVISFLAGGVFGFWSGLLLAEIASLCGSTLIFLCARWMRRGFSGNQWQSRLQAVDRHMRDRGFLTTLLMRLLPVPGVLVNIVTGLSTVPVATFLAASAIGFLPQNLIFTIYGCGLHQDWLQSVALATSLLLAFAIAIYLLCQYSATVQYLMLQLGKNRHDKSDNPPHQ